MEDPTHLLPPALPLTKLYSEGWIAKALTDFLWCVNVVMHFPAARSHNLTVLSIEPEMICGSESCVLTSATVLEWPVRVKMLARVRMSHTLTAASRPPLTSTSSVG